MTWLDKLLEPSAALATTMLKDQGGFSPFGYALRWNGTGQGYLPDGCDTLALGAVIRAGLDRGEYEYVVLVQDVCVTGSPVGANARAICYNVGSCNMNKRVLVPYLAAAEDLVFLPSTAEDLAPAPWPSVWPGEIFDVDL